MQSLIEPSTYFYSRDPAIDRNAEGLDEEAKAAKAKAIEKALRHANETGQPNGLPLREGRKLVAWKLAPLSERSYRELNRASGIELCSDAFRRSVVGATEATDHDGQPLKFNFEERPGGKVLTQATMELIFHRYKAGLILEIGLYVTGQCELDPQ